jgi:hypothetical protein
MLTTLAFLAALPLAPAQQGNLSLNNPRFTFGLLGPVRPDAKVLPGDSIALQFDIDNVTVDKEGKVKYSTALDVLDPKGKSIFMQPARDQEVFNTLGGHSLPGSASVFLGLEQDPGDYTLKVTVKDLQSQKSATLSQKFTVLPKAMGFVGLTTTSDADGRVPAGVLSVGESLFVNTAVIGFGRAGAAKQPNLTVEMTVLDDQNKPTLPKPFSVVVDEKAPKESHVDEKAVVVPFQFLVSLNRAGKFAVELKVTDNIAKKTVTQKIPFTVVPR